MERNGVHVDEGHGVEIFIDHVGINIYKSGVSNLVLISQN